MVAGSSGTPTKAPQPLQRYAPAFALLSATSAGFAASALAAPGLLLALALPGRPPSELAEPFVRIAGATMLLSTAVEWRLKVGGQRG